MLGGWIGRLFGSRRPDENQGQNMPDQEVGAGPDPQTPAPVLLDTPTQQVRKPEPEAGETAVRGGEPSGANPLRFTWHGATDRGRVRAQNEDSYSCVTFEKGSLFVVADGMGGHDAGEIASRIAVETVCREIGAGMAGQGQALLGLIENAVQHANTLVNGEGASKGSNMGTTISLALLTGDTAYVASVGDSRVYWTESGTLTQITQDHSLVASLVTAGELTKEGARNHPRSNILYRTVGRPERIAVDTFQVALKPGGTLLLCTDGLWGELGDERIGQTLASEETPQAICEKLIGMANAQAGKDNITAVVVRIA